MPVYAEQKEHTSTYDRVVEPNLDSTLRSNLKDEQSSSSSSSPVPSSSSTTTTSDIDTSAPSDVTTPVVVAPAPSQDQHVIIFDWDDTLLASSFLAAHGYRLDADMDRRENSEFVKNELKLLEACVITILNEALQRGVVNIITNAEHGWVELSAQKFLPGVVPYLSKVNVISARTTYEHLHPDSPVKWKYCAMHERLSGLISAEETRKNIMSFGDSHVEREAVRAVTRGAVNTRTKSIKFAECPNPEQLRKQLELVTNCFHYIFTHEGDLDLMLKMSMIPATNTPQQQQQPQQQQAVASA